MGVPGLRLPERPKEGQFVASSLQFRMPDFGAAAIQHFIGLCLARGVELKWFGATEPVAYTSNHHSWRYFDGQALPQTDRVLATLCDLRLPLTLSLEDCRTIGTIIRESVLETTSAVLDGGVAVAPALPEIS